MPEMLFFEKIVSKLKKINNLIRIALIGSIVFGPVVNTDDLVSAAENIADINEIPEQEGGQESAFYIISSIVPTTRDEYQEAVKNFDSTVENSSVIFSEQLSNWIGDSQERYDVTLLVVNLANRIEKEDDHIVLGRNFSNVTLPGLVLAAQELYRSIGAESSTELMQAFESLFTQTDYVWPRSGLHETSYSGLVDVLEVILRDARDGVQQNVTGSPENISSGIQVVERVDNNPISLDAIDWSSINPNIGVIGATSELQEDLRSVPESEENAQQINNVVEVQNTPPTQEQLREFFNLLDAQHEVFHFNSVQEMRDWMWDNHPEIDPDNLDPNSLRLWKEAQLDQSEITGIVILPESFSGRTLEQLLALSPPHVLHEILASGIDPATVTINQLEALNFSGGLSSIYESTQKMGLRSPGRLKTVVVFMPDELLGDGIASGNVSFPSYNPQVEVPSIIIAGERIWWTPNTWMIVDDSPYSSIELSEVKVVDADGSTFSVKLPIQKGWVHEQYHLTGNSDLYRYVIHYFGVYLDNNGQEQPISSLTHGWNESSYLVSESFFSVFGNMHSAQVIKPSVAEAIQTAIFQLNITDMISYYRSSSAIPFSIEIFENSGNQVFNTEDSLAALGVTATQQERAVHGTSVFSDRAMAQNFFPQPTTNPAEFLAPPTYMYLATLELSSGNSFSLPISNVFWLLQKMASPDNSNTSNLPVNVRIQLLGDPRARLAAVANNVAAQRSSESDKTQLIIDEQLLTESQLREELSKNPNSVLAQAELTIDSRLFNGTPEKIFWVWIAKPYRELETAKPSFVITEQVDNNAILNTTNTDVLNLENEEVAGLRFRNSKEIRYLRLLFGDSAQPQGTEIYVGEIYPNFSENTTYFDGAGVSRSIRELFSLMKYALPHFSPRFIEGVASVAELESFWNDFVKESDTRDLTVKVNNGTIDQTWHGLVTVDPISGRRDSVLINGTDDQNGFHQISESPLPQNTEFVIVYLTTSGGDRVGLPIPVWAISPHLVIDINSDYRSSSLSEIKSPNIFFMPFTDEYEVERKLLSLGGVRVASLSVEDTIQKVAIVVIDEARMQEINQASNRQFSMNILNMSFLPDLLLKRDSNKLHFSGDSSVFGTALPIISHDDSYLDANGQRSSYSGLFYGWDVDHFDLNLHLSPSTSGNPEALINATTLFSNAFPTNTRVTIDGIENWRIDTVASEFVIGSNQSGDLFSGRLVLGVNDGESVVFEPVRQGAGMMVVRLTNVDVNSGVGISIHVPAWLLGRQITLDINEPVFEKLISQENDTEVILSYHLLNADDYGQLLTEGRIVAVVETEAPSIEILALTK